MSWRSVPTEGDLMLQPLRGLLRYDVTFYFFNISEFFIYRFKSDVDKPLVYLLSCFR